MVDVHHRTAKIGEHSVFYREAGPVGAPVVLLLHGFPTSSHMFRELIPRLADRYHVIAPDHLGFGYSDAPPVGEFDYSFDALADVTEGLLERLGVERFAIYVQDYGAPIGWRLALRRPGAITAIVTQNGNGYAEGLVEEFWAPLRANWAAPGPATEEPLRAALTLDAIRWQHVHGVPDPSLVSPDTWTHDHGRVSREGNDRVQLALFHDYGGNLELYPKLHEYFRASGVPLLAVWGANDEIFAAAGATAFARDLPDAEVHLIDGGHFLLESHLDTVAGYLRGFLGRVLEVSAAVR
ncbi:alpha/beta fold hydrolase [Pseudonocardia acaciae]|uniref:alpha/beta fold hydrolase n=1 Tax=Pseudonocardia acaciae TaxID=551276 RepID=UPI00048A5F5C|nr:alpha/beta hydrolase [Pseudonocardia acaciae]